MAKVRMNHELTQEERTARTIKANAFMKRFAEQTGQLRTRESFYDSREWLDLRYQIIKKYGAKCQCCGTRATPDNPIQVDHIRPRIRFPHLELSPENLQVLCRDCNLGKGADDETDWRDS